MDRVRQLLGQLEPEKSVKTLKTGQSNDKSNNIRVQNTSYQSHNSTRNRDYEMGVNEENQCVIDHIVYYCKDLESSILRFEKLLGIKPVIAGRHKQWGSWNALFSLDNGTYFELLADDPKSSIKHNGFLKSLSNDLPNGEGIITYMIRIPNTYQSNLNDFRLKILEKTSYDLGNIFGGQRETGNGEILKWNLLCHTGISNRHDKNFNSHNLYQGSKGVFPVIIDWHMSKNKHPSNTSPKGCKLLRLKCFHPAAGEYRKIFNRMTMDLRWQIRGDEENRLEAVVMNANGKVIVIS